MPINYRDARPEFNGSSTHACPNEHLPSLRDALKAMPIKPITGGSIASGGEVPLTVILPHVQSLQVVDHNKGSLYWTCAKMLMLEHCSNAQILQAMQGEMAKLFNELHPLNPFKDHFAHQHHYGDSALSKIQLYWTTEITLALMDEAREKLGVIEVIHGDVRDLHPVDLLYISNAIEHSAYDRYDSAGHYNAGATERLQSAIINVLSKRRGGVVLHTNAGGFYTLPGCENLIPAPKRLCTHSCTWSYNLNRRPIEAVAVKRHVNYMEAR